MGDTKEQSSPKLINLEAQFMLTMLKDGVGCRLILLDDTIIGEIKRQTRNRWDGTLWLNDGTLRRHAGTAQDTFHALKTAHYWHLDEKKRVRVLEHGLPPEK
jgi:hypothetical protein